MRVYEVSCGVNVKGKLWNGVAYYRIPDDPSALYAVLSDACISLCTGVLDLAAHEMESMELLIMSADLPLSWHKPRPNENCCRHRHTGVPWEWVVMADANKEGK